MADPSQNALVCRTYIARKNDSMQASERNQNQAEPDQARQRGRDNNCLLPCAAEPTPGDALALHASGRHGRTRCRLRRLRRRLRRRWLKPLQRSNHAIRQAALERLAPCHLNLYAEEGSLPAYTITRTDSEQDAILRALRLQHLADDQELADRIHPR